MAKKKIEVVSQDNSFSYVNKNGKTIAVWQNDYYIYSAPADKLWQSKRMSKDEYELVVSKETFSPQYSKLQQSIIDSCKSKGSVASLSDLGYNFK